VLLLGLSQYLSSQAQFFPHIQSSQALSDFWNAFKACTTPIEENLVI
jgi:hypothetical protein